MKNFILLCFLCLNIVFVKAQDDAPEYQKKAESLPKTSVRWLEEEYDFKMIKEGDKVSHTFYFQNTGNEPLFITHVKPSCGCTSPTWTKEAVAPGSQGKIEIEFNSKGRPGAVQKSISIYGNFEGITHQLRFKGEVQPIIEGHTNQNNTENNVSTAIVSGNSERDSVPASTYESNVPDFQQKAESLPKTSVKWLEEEYDFKRVKEGDKVRHTFKLKNTGKEPLYITHVKPSCGCTTPTWTKEPIAPGEQGLIEIEFNSKGRPGVVQKNINVYGNFEGITHQLRFKGEVIPVIKTDDGSLH